MGAESSSLDSVVELPNDNEQFDTAAYAAAAIFNAVALPKGMPDFLKRAIEAQAERERAQPGPMTMASTNDTAETQEDRDKKATERAADQVNQIAQQQQHEREEWAHTTSTAGGITMDGAQWAELAKRLRDDDGLRDRIMTAFLERGMTEKEAEARYERVAEIAEIMAIPPAQRTDEQKQTVTKAEADPSFKKDQQTVSEFTKDDSPAVGSPLQTSFAAASTGAASDAVNVSTPVERPTVIANGPGF